MNLRNLFRKSLLGIVMLTLVNLSTAFAAVDSPESAAPTHKVVITENGPVRGFKTPAASAFLGIPYAAAPVGELRWQPPQPHARWTTPLDATAFGNACAQTAGILNAGSDAEDCLFLNVFAPRGEEHEDEEGRAVMVFIHGGGLTTGESNSYDPTKLVEDGGVIVVTINYRLGILGFLTHPALTAESSNHASGNYGLMDQQFALKWVRRNIARFGGNPYNVTIFGESAGGLSVHANLASPTAAGLFRKAIAESGAYSLAQPTLAVAEGLGAAVASLAGCTSQTAACLRGLPVSTILTIQTVVAGGGIVPTVDGQVLTQSVGAAFASGQFNHVPVIEGSNHDEWRLFVGINEIVTGKVLAAGDYIPEIQATLGISDPAVATFIATSIYPLAAYPPASTAPSIALGAVSTDAIIACNTRLVSRFLAAYVPTYEYEFNDHTAPIPAGYNVSFPTGAYHSAELQYLFGPASLGLPGLSADQNELSDAMVRYWTRFARTGNPNSVSVPAWPAYSPSDQFQSLELLTPVTKTTFAADHKCRLWGTP